MAWTICALPRRCRYLSGNRLTARHGRCCRPQRSTEEDDMSAVMTSYDDLAVTTSRRRGVLRGMGAGAAVFDAGMGVACLLAASTFGGWLSIGTGDVRATGIVFLLAGVVGAETALRPSIGVRWIVGANLVFAAWCLG